VLFEKAVEVPTGELHLQVVVGAVLEGRLGQDLSDALTFEGRRNDRLAKIDKGGVLNTDKKMRT
jgi:hypothetical protein